MIDTTWPELIKNSYPITDQLGNTCPRIYPLTDTCIVEIRGDGAEKLLQGQITCDVRTLNDQQGAFGAICTPQGRMFSLFRIIRTEQSFLLKMNQSTVAHFLERIEKYRQFFKAEIQVKTDWVSFGLYLPDDITADAPTLNTWLNSLPKTANGVFVSPDNSVFRLPTLTKYYEIWARKDSWLEDTHNLPLINLLTGLQPSAALNDVNEWNIQMALSGIPELAEQNVDQLVPHMINLHKIGGISFKKGCYTGQEIVARMEYLGKLKKQVVCYQTSDNKTFNAEAVIKDLDGTNLGSIISSYKNKDGTAGMALLQKIMVDELEKSNHALNTVIDGREASLSLSIPNYLPL